MRAQERRVRAKPAVAFASEESARSNIQTKLTCLLDLLKMQKAASPGARDTILKNLPSSQRGFNGWASLALDARTRKLTGEFHSNSRVALHRSGMLERVEKALASVVAERYALKSPGKREATVAGLQRKLEIEFQLRRIGEDEILRLRRNVNELVEENGHLKNQLEAANREAALLSKSGRGFDQSSKGRVVKLASVAPKSKERSR